LHRFSLILSYPTLLRYFREAVLEIVKEYSEDKTEEYEIQTIMIEISNKMFEEYYSFHHGQQIK